MDFTATYDPNRTLNASMQANALGGGGLLGNFDFNGFLDNAMARSAYWKRASANAAADDAEARAIRQKNMFNANSTPQIERGNVAAYGKGMPLRDLFQTNEAMRGALSGGSNTVGAGIGQNAWWNTLPMAGSVAGVSMPAKTGWDWYAQMAQAGANPSSQAVQTTGNAAQQKAGLDTMSGADQYLQAMRMYQPDTYAALMQPKGRG